MKYGRWVIRSREKRSDSDLFTLFIYMLAAGFYIAVGYANWVGDNYPVLADRFSLPMVAGLSEIEQIELDGRFELPPSALKIDVQRRGFFETAIGVIFEMESRHFDAFMESTLCRAPGSVELDPRYLIRQRDIQEPASIVCYAENQGVVQLILQVPLDAEKLRVGVITGKSRP